MQLERWRKQLFFTSHKEVIYIYNVKIFTVRNMYVVSFISSIIVINAPGICSKNSLENWKEMERE